MRVTLLTLAILLAMEVDLQVLILFLALLPAAGALFFVCLLLAPAAKRRDGRRARPQRDDRKWRGVHRSPSTPGRHAPARGKRLQGLSRQAQLEESTERLDARDVARIFNVPPALLRGAVVDDPLKETTEAWLAPEPHEHKPYWDGLRIRCRTCKLDLDQPEGMPEVGRGGMWSWDGSTRLGPRPVRPRMAPETPPPGA